MKHLRSLISLVVALLLLVGLLELGELVQAATEATTIL
jgi:hypothetical protein